MQAELKPKHGTSLRKRMSSTRGGPWDGASARDLASTRYDSMYEEGKGVNKLNKLSISKRCTGVILHCVACT